LSEGTNGKEFLQTGGSHSRAEILSQPECWGKCLRQMETSPLLAEISKRFGGADEWIFIGCGSSYYIALAAAASWSSLTGMRARAVPASEALLFPDLIFAGSKSIAPVVISRSGRTSEALRATEFLEKQRNIRTLAITCSAGQALEHIATTTVALTAANEASTVMSRSFTSMLLGLQFIAASLAKNSVFLAALAEMPAAALKALRRFHSQIQDFVSNRAFVDYAYLGQGPFYGLACEAALKVTEMSVSFAQSFHTLEFRHGPKSIVSPETLIGVLLSESNFEIELQVLQEVKSLGGTTFAITPKADSRVNAAADLVVELDLGVPEFARLAPYVVPGQLLGLYTGLKKGLDPDNPRNLTRAVVLEDPKPTTGKR
jgi:glutamine---fructose-6-phosphate transaminase (isomerizing)